MRQALRLRTLAGKAAAKMVCRSRWADGRTWRLRELISRLRLLRLDGSSASESGRWAIVTRERTGLSKFLVS